MRSVRFRLLLRPTVQSFLEMERLFFGDTLMRNIPAILEVLMSLSMALALIWLWSAMWPQLGYVMWGSAALLVFWLAVLTALEGAGDRSRRVYKEGRGGTGADR